MITNFKFRFLIRNFIFIRSSLMEVKQDLQERTMRWRQIETLCGFPIATNPGLNYLETLLRSGMNSSRYIVLNPCKLIWYSWVTLVVKLCILFLARQGTLEEDNEMGDETSSLVSSCAGKRKWEVDGETGCYYNAVLHSLYVFFPSAYMLLLYRLVSVYTWIRNLFVMLPQYFIITLLLCY